MSSSYYPPGVTGREWQISGPELEREESHVCDSIVTIHNIPQLAIGLLMTARSQVVPLTQLSFAPDHPPLGDEDKRQIAADIYRKLCQAVQNISDGAEVPCPWEGEVPVSYVDGIGIWHCPCCGTEHEVESPDYEPDDL